jgi:hypothetical protein
MLSTATSTAGRTVQRFDAAIAFRAMQRVRRSTEWENIEEA